MAFALGPQNVAKTVKNVGVVVHEQNLFALYR